MHANDRPGGIAAWMRKVEARHAELDTRLRAANPGQASGSTVATTDGSGRASFLFGRTYPAPPVVILTGGNGEQVSVYANTVTTTGFTAQFQDGSGTLLTSYTVRCNWLAFPA